MGFQHTITGFIRADENLDSAGKPINSLPLAKDNYDTIWVKEAFTLTQNQNGRLSYKDEFMIHFGMIIKEIDHQDWLKYLKEFERIFKSINSIESFIRFDLTYWKHAKTPDDAFYYHWRKSVGSSNWKFTSDLKDFHA